MILPPLGKAGLQSLTRARRLALDNDGKSKQGLEWFTANNGCLYCGKADVTNTTTARQASILAVYCHLYMFLNGRVQFGREYSLLNLARRGTKYNLDRNMASHIVPAVSQLLSLHKYMTSLFLTYLVSSCHS
jgi:hypothetical protein